MRTTIRNRIVSVMIAGTLVPAVLCSCGNAEATMVSSDEASAEESTPVTAADSFRNLAQSGTAVASSSADASTCGPEKAIDGDPDTAWEADQASDQIVIDFGEQKTFSYLRIVWKSTDISGYVLETSDDGQNYTAFYTSPYPPYLAEDLIDLRKAGNETGEEAAAPSKSAASGRYLRVTVNGKSQIGEIEVYESDPWEPVFAKLTASVREDGEGVQLEGLPSGITAEFGGCNYEQVIDDNGTVHEPLEDKTVNVGYWLTCHDWTVMTPDLPVTVPAAAQENRGQNAKPSVTPELQEWKSGAGTLVLDVETVQAIASLPDRAAEESFETGQISCSYVDPDKFAPGEEGYEIAIDDSGIRVRTSGLQGRIWAWRTLQQMCGDGRSLPCGMVRDYPEYPSRGFEIDVARSFVSMDTLYRIADAMSEQKMNELTVHLNDNEILGDTANVLTEEEVFRERYSAYRMESEIAGEGLAAEDGDGKENGSGSADSIPAEDGGNSAQTGRKNIVRITAADGFYTQEEFAALVSYAASMGVKVIPEIDTPAHSLAFTKAFPDLALHYESAALQYLDVTKEGVLPFAEKLWAEQLNMAFEGCDAVHIGGDEYYGDAQGYVDYENGLISFLRQQGKKVRLWGSLRKLRNPGSARLDPADGEVRMVIWNTLWADPELMLRAGFSLLNADNAYTYIVPNGTGNGSDLLDQDAFRENYRVNCFTDAESASESGSPDRIIVLPSWPEQLRGGQYSLWNDYSRSLGISEDGIYERFADALKTVSGRLWKE